jgi:hypothetical protein
VSKTEKDLQASELANWAAAVMRIAEEAGTLIMEVYTAEGELEVEHKSDDSPLTLADRRAHPLYRKGSDSADAVYPYSVRGIREPSLCSAQHLAALLAS